MEKKILIDEVNKITINSKFKITADGDTHTYALRHIYEGDDDSLIDIVCLDDTEHDDAIWDGGFIDIDEVIYGLTNDILDGIITGFEII